MWKLSIGYVVDILFGDPYWLPHPVRLIGCLISFLEGFFIGKEKNGDHDFNENITNSSESFQIKRLKRIYGVILLVVVCSISYVVPFVILKIALHISYKLEFIIEATMIYQILATKCLASESQKVARALKSNDILKARDAISNLVSRDTKNMTEEDIVKATVETISENTIDGIVSPIFFILIGGAPLGWAFKAVNTLDSMVGYKNQRYIDFGWASARFDDIANYIPARITAFFILVASLILGFDSQNAWKIFLRDKKNHTSPNSPIAESITAGALRIQLGGRASYFGVESDKPTMGDNIEIPGYRHIYDANYIMYVVSFLAVVSCFIVEIIF